MKWLVHAILWVVLAGEVVPAQASRDPDRPVRGAGIQVDGWTGRTDRDDQRLEDVRLVEWPGGYRLTTGPHAILWDRTSRASGDYAVSARLTKTRESVSVQEESYGLFIAGSALTTGRQNYLYCIVFGSGTVMVRHRGGSRTATLLGKTVHPAISRMGPDGASDVVSLWVRGDRVGCTVNGAEVFSADRRAMVGPGKLASTDGVYGIRASHNLDVIVEGLQLTVAR